MKIAFIARNDGTDTRQGKICDSLHQFGHDVVYIGWDRSTDPPKKPIFDPAIPRHIFRWKAEFGGLSSSGWPEFAAFVARWLGVYQPDVIHVRDEPLALLLRPLRGISYRHLVLDIFDSLAARNYKNPALNGASWAVRRAAQLGADRIIETSEKLRSMLGPFAAKAEVILNSPSDPGEQVARSYPEAEAVQICTGGSLSRQREGLDILLRAVDLLPPGTVEIQASGWLHDEYAREVFIKHPAVHYKWLNSPDDFRQVAARCDAISYLRADSIRSEYRSWVLPQRVFDAMSIGRPLLLSRAMKIAPWIEEIGLGYMYTPGDYQGLADVFLQLKARRAELPGYVSRIRQIYTRDYTWAAQEQRLATLYAGLV